jgi:hypothetical protein
VRATGGGEGEHAGEEEVQAVGQFLEEVAVAEEELALERD